MAKENLEQLYDEMSDDIARSWIDARLLRKDIGDTHTRMIVISRGKVVADYMSEFTDNSEREYDTAPARSMFGERVSEKTLRESGYRSGRTIKFNTITRELEFVNVERKAPVEE